MNDTNKCCFSLEKGYERCFTLCILFSSTFGWRGSVSLQMNVLIFSITPLLCLTSYTYSKSTVSQSTMSNMHSHSLKCSTNSTFFVGIFIFINSASRQRTFHGAWIFTKPTPEVLVWNDNTCVHWSNIKTCGLDVEQHPIAMHTGSSQRLN